MVIILEICNIFERNYACEIIKSYDRKLPVALIMNRSPRFPPPKGTPVP